MFIYGYGMWNKISPPNPFKRVNLLKTQTKNFVRLEEYGGKITNFILAKFEII